MNQYVTSGLPFDLSAQEYKIVLMLCDDKRLKDIARELDLSPKTVSTYKYRIREKLGVKTNIGMYKKLRPTLCKLCRRALIQGDMLDLNL